jgi:phosphoribosylaminoimidazole-succinocarboxamide synthase
MNKAITATDFNFPGQTNVYKGKVRDVYTINNDLMIMVASDRISAFDVILPKGIPYKGQVLNQVATHFLEATRDICPNWLLTSPDPTVAIGQACEPIRIEMVIRGYLSGHAWREYKSGKRMICGLPMSAGMKENDKFQEPIITPAAKAMEGHDVDISREDILKQGLISESLYEQLEYYTRALFKRGSEMAAGRGLILVDTKYEFGLRDGKVVLIDEIHTPDSSRYFYADTYEEIQAKDQKQRQLSKEFVREWLIENGFQGLEGQTVPEMSDEFVNTITERYIELYEKITGSDFIRHELSNPIERIEKNVNAYLSTLSE